MTYREKVCLRRQIKKLSVAQLDELLVAELQKDQPEEGVVLPILKELEKREGGSSAAITENPDRWKKGRPWIAGAITAAAVALAFVLMIPQSAGAENILDLFVQWSQDVISFFDPESEPKITHLSEFVTDHPGLQQLYDKVTELGGPQRIVPMWLPEGFTLEDLKVTPFQGGEKVHARFVMGEYIITISYRIFYNADLYQYENNDTSFEVFEHFGVKHYILDNEGNCTVKWAVPGAECSIAADVDRDDIYSIIQSVYRSTYGEKIYSHALSTVSAYTGFSRSCPGSRGTSGSGKHILCVLCNGY